MSEQEFKSGDKVFASRRQRGNHMLSTPCHKAVILCIAQEAGVRGKTHVTVEYEEDRGKNWLKRDTIPFVSRKYKNLKQSTTIKRREESSEDEEVDVVEAAGATIVPDATDTEANQVPLPPPAAAGFQVIPLDFGKLNAVQVFPGEVPHHVVAR